MNILCTICHDLVIQAENINVTQCGHIFHHHCLAQWIARSKTCPQCRNKVTDKCMFRIYPTVSKESGGVNAASLQSRLDKAQLQLREERANIKEIIEKNVALYSDLSVNFKKQKEIINKYEREIDSLKEENETLQNKIQRLYRILFLLESKKNQLRDRLFMTNHQLNMTNQQFQFRTKSADDQQYKINFSFFIFFIFSVSYIIYTCH